MTTWYLDDYVSGVRAEKLYNGTDTTWKDHLFAPGSGSGAGSGRMVGQRTTVNGGAASWNYFVQDHLGSLAVISDNTGAVISGGRLSYDAWGKRRNTDGSDGTPTVPVTTRGFTGHEALDAIGLVNMNARLYDPAIGRFMTPDPIVQAPLFW